jgi:hypothetical protein
MDQNLLVTVLSIAVPALILWIWGLWNKQTKDKEDLLSQINSLALKLADGYHNKQELREVMAELLAPLRDDVRSLKEAYMGGRNGHSR